MVVNLASRRGIVGFLAATIICTFGGLPWAAVAEVVKFEGDLRPITSPITLRYHSLPYFKQEMSFRTKVSSPKQIDITLSFNVEGSVRSFGDLLQWSANVWSKSSSSELRDSEKPMLMVLTTDALGSISQVDLSGLAPFTGNQLRPGTDEYKTWSESMANGVQTLPSEPVTQGADIFAGISKAQFAKRLNLPPAAAGTFNMTGIARGLSKIDGLTCVIVDMAGTIQMDGKDGSVSALISGYAAYDKETGMPIDGRILVDMTIEGAKSAKVTMDVINHTTLH